MYIPDVGYYLHYVSTIWIRVGSYDTTSCEHVCRVIRPVSYGSSITSRNQKMVLDDLLIDDLL